MKTLIINGSPRPNGDTQNLISRLLPMLEGEIVTVNAYRDNIHACIDCRMCWKNPGCAVKDGMAAIYDAMGECDNILLASPVYYRNLTPPVINILTRMQILYAAQRFHDIDLQGPQKKGALLLIGGGSGKPDMAQTTGKILLHQLNAWDLLDPIMYLDTDNVPAADLPALDEELRKIAEHFNKKA
ncbi:MAG: flavodoxin family protein [Clostridia bacterium]|nr:flavodoxin family protein [Clostridia bacterium]